MPKLNRKVSAHRVAVLIMIQALHEDRHTSVADLVEETGMGRTTVLSWIREMKRMKLIHLSQWRKTELNNPAIPCFKWGTRPNAVKPAKVDPNIRSRAYRARKKLRRLTAAITDPSRIDPTTSP